MQALKQTPLYDFHVRYGAKMVSFSGWEMPLLYNSILEEHMAVRKKVALFDISHMGEILVEGKNAEAFLDCVLTNHIAILEKGKCVYTLMCNENGGILEDLIAYKLDPERYFLCVNACNIEKNMAWLHKQNNAFNCALENVSGQWAQIAIQGPSSGSLISKIFPQSEYLHAFSFKKEHFKGSEAIISRTGYTGEDGFEVYAPPKCIEALAEAVLYNGKEYDILLAGLGARDSLRIEAGYPLYGHEIDAEKLPFEAGLNFAVKLDKPSHFIGKDALVTYKKSNNAAKKVFFFILEGKSIAREKTPIFNAINEVVGEVLSASFSPVLNKPIGSAWLFKPPPCENLNAHIRSKNFSLSFKKPPLHKV